MSPLQHGDAGIRTALSIALATDDEQQRKSRPLLLDETSGLSLLDRAPLA